MRRKPTIGIIHNSLNIAGGGERLCLKIIESFKEVGYKVVLGTVEPTDWLRVEQMIGKVIKPDKEVSLFKFKIRIFGIYLRIISFLLVIRLRKECDVIINTHGDILPVQVDIIYMHYPMFTILEDLSSNIKYSKNIFWKMYFIPYAKIQKLLSKRNFARIILTNSNFSMKAINKFINRNAIIVYPPVEIEKFLTYGSYNCRENIIISCGRYSEEKNFHFLLELSKKISKKYRIIIIGTCSNKISYRYFNNLSKMKLDNNLENILLLKNVDYFKMLELYRKSKIYIHAMKNEHFGISIIEAMAGGLVPIIHRSGGPWEDILQKKQGLYGFSYISLDEAIKYIKKVLENDQIRKEMVKRNINYIKDFSDVKFKNKILTIFKEYIIKK